MVRLGTTEGREVGGEGKRIPMHHAAMILERGGEGRRFEAPSVESKRGSW